ncbi:MAG: DUF2325 domain-containing protein [Clostridia bacterium]|nr:DUF2325 domain-containing protein [Clostridia bacterium]
MSVVIVGGNECMVRQYKTLCKEYSCKAKIYPKMCGGLKNIGNPDMRILFTATTSHKMVQCALSQAKNQNIPITRSHSSSMAALRTILEENVGKTA